MNRDRTYCGWEREVKIMKIDEISNMVKIQVQNIRDFFAEAKLKAQETVDFLTNKEETQLRAIQARKRADQWLSTQLRKFKGKGDKIPYLKHLYMSRLRKISEYLEAEKALRNSFYTIPLDYSENFLVSRQFQQDLPKFMTFEELTESLMEEMNRRISYIKEHGTAETAKIMRIPTI